MERPSGNHPRKRQGRKQGHAPGVPPGAEPRWHHHTRQAHAVETAEDYVEVIANLIRTEGEARVVDVARRLGVTHVTVNRTIARLQRDGWVTAKPYRSIFLTPAGLELAHKVEKRHHLVIAFLRALGVPDAAASADAEGIEHHVGEETLRAFERFLTRHKP